MVMRKFLERLETDDNKELLENLFYEVWGEKLFSNRYGTSVRVTVVYPKSTPVFSILVILSQNITDVSYDDFNELFMFLKKMKVSFGVGDSKQLFTSIVDIDDFIKELKQLKDIKKYNL